MTRVRLHLRSQIALATIASQVVLATWLAGPVSAATRIDGASDAPIADAAAERVIATPCANAADCPAQPTHDEDLPWCVSADDPRCAPLHTGTRSHDTDGHRIAPSAACDTTSMAVASAYRASFAPARGLSPQAGIDHRVERPPRTAERSVRAL